MPLIVQSKHIAKAIPITPILKYIAKLIENINLPKTVDAIETIIVYFTSPVALSPLLSGPENGNATVLNML